VHTEGAGKAAPLQGWEKLGTIDADEFRPREIRCETFVDAARQAGYRVDYHLHPGYDHSYYTIASYIGAHIAFHAEALGLGKP